MTPEPSATAELPQIDPNPILPEGFPMPRAPELLEPGAARVRVRSRTNRFPFPIPNGWFIVATAAEIDPGELKAVHYFGEDLIVYRTASGEPRTTEAYCPHLGAHIAVGGKVEGDCVSCPFHGWTFDGSGQCVDIPYAETERIPAKARLRTYPTIERNGMIWAWHHLQEGEPFYDVPVVPEVEDPEWLEPMLREFRIATSCQEMAENNHDHAHFKYVHGTDAIPEANERIEGTYKYVEGAGLQRETFGLGLGVLRIPSFMTFFSSVTPVDEDNVHIRWVFTAPVSSGQDVLDQVIDGFTSGVTQDIPIWENKVYRPRPILTKGEAGISQHRLWSRQFYSFPDGEPDEL